MIFPAIFSLKDRSTQRKTFFFFQWSFPIYTSCHISTYLEPGFASHFYCTKIGNTYYTETSKSQHQFKSPECLAEFQSHFDKTPKHSPILQQLPFLSLGFSVKEICLKEHYTLTSVTAIRGSRWGWRVLVMYL